MEYILVMLVFTRLMIYSNGTIHKAASEHMWEDVVVVLLRLLKSLLGLHRHSLSYHFRLEAGYKMKIFK